MAKVESKEIEVPSDEDFQSRQPTAEELKALSEKVDTTEKPRYNKLTLLTIESAIPLKADEPEKDGNGEEFVKWRVMVRYDDKHTETFSGLRAYKDRIWMSNRCGYSRIKTMLEYHIKAEKKLALQEFVKELVGRKVRVKSEDWEFSGQKGFKNMPIEFVDDKEPK